jgi:N-acyl-D-aspartate/D-glutamate deacylase
VDCSGLVAAPGFIDLHSHSDLQVLSNHRAKADQFSIKDRRILAEGYIADVVVFRAGRQVTPSN